MTLHLVAVCIVLALPRLLRGELHWWLLVGPLGTAVSGAYGQQYTPLLLLLLVVLGTLVIMRRGFKDGGLRLRAAIWGLPLYMAVTAWLNPGGSSGLVLYLGSSLVFLLVGWCSAPLPRRDVLFLLTVAFVALDILSGLSGGVTVATTSTAVERSIGFFTSNGGANVAGAFSALALMLSLALLASVGEVRQRVYLVVVSLLCVGATVSTLSRRALLAAGVAAILAFIGRRTVRRAIALITISVLPFVLLVGVGTPVRSLLQNLDTRLSRAREDADYRGSEWQMFDAGSHFQQWFGGGLDHGKYFFREGGQTTLIPVHNSYLFALLAFGLVGASWLAALIVVSLFRGVRMSLRTPQPEMYAATLVLTVICVSAYFGEAFVVGPFSFAFWVAIGAIQRRARKDRESESVLAPLAR